MAPRLPEHDETRLEQCPQGQCRMLHDNYPIFISSLNLANKRSILPISPTALVTWINPNNMRAICAAFPRDGKEAVAECFDVFGCWCAAQ